MKFYYTGALTFNTPQTEITKSLGGLMSSSVVPNNSLNSVFSEISMFGPNLSSKNVIGLIFKNEMQNVTNLKVWFETDPANLPISTFKINVVNPGIGTNGEVYIEKINSMNSDPYIGEFYSADGEVNALILGNLDLNKSLGFWIKREINEAAIKEFYSNENLESRYLNNTPVSNQEKIIFKISFDLV